MQKRVFSSEAQARIKQNSNVLKVSETTITYCPDFKVRAVRASLFEEKTPIQIFEDAGFDLDLIGRKIPKRCLGRWREIFTQRGEEALRNDQRGKHVADLSSEGEVTVEEKLRRAEARVRYLEEENKLLKKFRAIERTWLKDPRRSTR